MTTLLLRSASRLAALLATSALAALALPASAATVVVQVTVDVTQIAETQPGSNLFGVQGSPGVTPGALSFALAVGDTLDYRIAFVGGQTLSLTLGDSGSIWPLVYSSNGGAQDTTARGTLELLDGNGATLMTSIEKTDTAGVVHIGQSYFGGDFPGSGSTLTFSGVRYVGTVLGYAPSDNDSPTITTRDYEVPGFYFSADSYATAVPEPGPASLLAVGALTLWLQRRRRGVGGQARASRGYGSAMPVVVAACLAGLAAGAKADPITPFNDTLLAWHTPDVAAPAFFDSAADRRLQTADGALAASSITTSGSGAWGSASGMAAADLATGTLKSRSTISFVNPADPSLYMQSNAKFGDGFRTTTPGGTQPFTWLPGTGARFSMHVDGSIQSTQPLGSSSDPGAFLILSLYQPGTLTAEQNPLAGSNLIRYYAYFLGNPNQGLLSCFQGNCVPVLPTASYNSIDAGGIDIVQDIQPGSDFDWQILLGSAGWLYEPGSYDLDFSHTVTVGYQGPAGALTQSVSGVFANIEASAVPEPATWLLSVAGLVLLGARARRRG